MMRRIRHLLKDRQLRLRTQSSQNKHRIICLRNLVLQLKQALDGQCQTRQKSRKMRRVLKRESQTRESYRPNKSFRLPSMVKERLACHQLLQKQRRVDFQEIKMTKISISQLYIATGMRMALAIYKRRFTKVKPIKKAKNRGDCL
ncbi:hypothetical protein FGO68_gene7470 [Halteria grandinella]|uniref:Uncharacterized protein n=1 Tax=Halteria grandinella TaxID=5974 RepID=A0A8J8P931_HALGN|nr:hypothetical protein FGO68_gene7470 [Halteria grandinella]